MFKLAIVEDELLMRNFLVDCIDYKSLGLSLCGAFCNAEKALAVLSVDKPDIVITDIKMLEMDGIEFMSKLLENSHETRFVVISNYLDFPIVRNAFQLGICDYIPKVEFSTEYFKKILFDIIQKIKTESGNIRAVLYEKEKYLKETFWSTNILIKDDVSLRINMNSLLVCSVYILNYENIIQEMWNNNKELMKYGVSNYLEEVLVKFGNGEFFFNNYDEILLMFSPSKSGNKEIKEFLMEVTSFFENNFDVISCVTMSESYVPMCTLKSYYSSLCSLRQYRFFMGEEMVITTESVQDYNDKLDAITAIVDFEKLFENLDFSGINKKITEIAFVKPDCESVQEMKRVYRSLFLLVHKYDRLYEAGFARSENFETILQFSNYKVAEEYLLNASKLLFEKIFGSNIDIQKVVEYIKRNYAKDLTLKNVAKVFKYEYNYFSKIFFNRNGVTFKKYIIDVRLTEAMRLVKHTGLKYHTIAERVGYQNYEHFSRSFRKKYKKWPKEIRENETDA